MNNKMCELGYQVNNIIEELNSLTLYMDFNNAEKEKIEHILIVLEQVRDSLHNFVKPSQQELEDFWNDK